jgi:integrase
VLCQDDGASLTQKIVQYHVRRAARRVNLRPGVHVLRHTFCSHLAMRGALARAFQALAGPQDLSTTQRYMHVSPAAVEDAIRLLDQAAGLRRGNLVMRRLALLTAFTITFTTPAVQTPMSVTPSRPAALTGDRVSTSWD